MIADAVNVFQSYSELLKNLIGWWRRCLPSLRWRRDMFDLGVN